MDFAYTGWNCAGYIAGEISKPRKTLPIALIGGTLITTVIYAIVNYYCTNDWIRRNERSRNGPIISIECGRRGKMVSLFIITHPSKRYELSSIHTQTAATRVIQAMGQEGIFLILLGRHTRATILLSTP